MGAGFCILSADSRRNRREALEPPAVAERTGRMRKSLMERKMEATGSILGLYRDNGKENRNQYLEFSIHVGFCLVWRFSPKQKGIASTIQKPRKITSVARGLQWFPWTLQFIFNPVFKA